MFFKDLNLSSKVTGYSTIMLIIVMTIITTIVYQQTREAIFEKIGLHFKKDASILKSFLLAKLESYSAEAHSIASMPPIQELIELSHLEKSDSNEDIRDIWILRLTKTMQSVLHTNSALFQARMLDPSGQELFKVVKGYDNVIRVVNKEKLQNKSHRDYVSALKGHSPGSLYYSSIGYNMENGEIEEPKRITMRIVNPVFDNNQDLFAFLVFNIDLERMLRRAAHLTAQKYHLIISDKSKHKLVYDYHSDKFKMKDQGEITVLSKLKNYTDDYFVEEISIGTEMAGSGEILSFQLISEKSDVLQVESLKLESLGKNILLVLTVAFFLTYFVHKYLLSALMQLASALEHADSPIFALKPFVNREDEIGVIARAFDAKMRLLNSLAHFDSLTGLPNRKSLYCELGKAINRAKRTGTNLALVYIDINKFKSVNDQYGHDYGDKLIIATGRMMKKSTRDTDFVARLSGDEFVTIFTEITSDTDLDKLIGNFTNRMNTSHKINGVNFNVTYSFGVAVFPDHGIDEDELLRMADSAMYISKHNGNGEPVIYSKSS